MTIDPAALLARWSALPPKIRTIAAALCAAALFASIVAAVLTHSQRVALFAGGLQPDQLTEVEERLASWNVPFTPVADNVLVDGGRRGDLLLKLSMAGTPHAHVQGTSDILGKLGALTPQTVIDAQTRSGLAGDIELSLRGIAGIDDARVIIAPAREAYYADDTSSAATASVKLTLQPGARLSPQAVDGIRSFVAAGVPDLDPRNVKIVDDRGVVLGDGAADAGEPDLERALQSALDSTLGAGATLVRVHLDYDRSRVTRKDVRRSALSPVPISANTQAERYSDTGKHYERTMQDLDRGSETSEENSSTEPGRVARISAAVFVDSAQAADLAQVRALAAATLGIDPRRGDVLEVQAMPFTRSRSPRKDGWWLAYGALVPLLPALVLAVAGLVAVRCASGPLSNALQTLIQRAAVVKAAENARGIAPAGVRASLANEPPHTAAAIISALPAATAAAVLEMYPEHERSAIVRRMHRPGSPLFPDAESFITHA